jgi:uncharacterized protein
MWTYERTVDGGQTPYRAFVSIPGHLYENFNRPNYRAILLRGIAWAGKRANADELLTKNELGDNLRYVEGGPTAPAKAAAKIEVHPEFDLTLVAAEPLIHKAMNIDWDERGRLWVAETPEYPNGRKVPNAEPWKDSGYLRRQQDREPEDTISILSDTNGDGVMDRKHVFADKLELVTGFVFYRRGVIAATSPDIWYLEDTNGDQIADRRTRLYTGLGTEDTHAVINNLRWGLDGWIYATHGYSVGTVTSPDGSKRFGRDGSGVVRFKPDGSAFEQFSSRNGNTWGLDITWDGQVFWTQPTSGTVFFHTVLPESVLAKGRLPGTTSYKGMITGQNTYPLMTPPEQAYVQIDQVGQFTAAAGCAVYDGGAWPDKWRYSYFTGEPTLNIVHQEFVKPDGVSFTTQKETGREQTEFMRSQDLWFRPIETRVGPDGALYIVDFYNQAVIHNDTRGPLHGPANAAIRPDRDHYFGRIWRVQHKQARKLDVPDLSRADLPRLIRVIETSPNAHVKQTAWRLAQENHASDKRLAQIKRPMGSKALETYEQARASTTVAARKGVLDSFATSTDNWTRSALVSAATEQAAAYVTESLTYSRPQTLTDFVTAVLPAALPEHAARLLADAAAAGPDAVVLKASVVRAIARMEGGAIVLDAPTTAALQTLLDEPETRAAAVAVVAQWDKAGVLSAKAGGYVAAMVRELGEGTTSEARRIDSASALLRVPARRAETLSMIAPMLSDQTAPASLKAGLIAVLGESAGADADADAVLITALARTNSALVFDQLLKRPASSLALLSALKDGTITTANLGPANVARLRTHPDRQVATQAAALLDSLSPAGRTKADIIATLLPDVEKPGDAAKGRALFVGACSTCHKLGDVGTSDAGPPLTGIGAHPRAELLARIVDPNREVDPSFWQWNITTRNNQTLVGVIARENAASITLRGPAGDVEIKKDDITNRENTRRSLMPEGFEALGAEALRDILTFLGASQTPAAGAAADAQGPKEGGKGDAPLPQSKPIVWAAGKTKVLVIGGGSSHDFGKFFGGTDVATLTAAGFSVNYTEDRDQAAAEVGKADVAVISVNRQFFDTPAYRKALADFAASGKGLVMLHPGTWYGYAQWPELNATIVGGGARGHDRIARFSVNAVKPDHPVMKGVPASFDVEDELYYVNAEPDKIPAGTAAIDVLAETSPSVRFKQPHPSVWITRHPTARIVGVALGHDERVHDLQAFKTLLINSVTWAGRK